MTNVQVNIGLHILILGIFIAKTEWYISVCSTSGTYSRYRKIYGHNCTCAV